MNLKLNRQNVLNNLLFFDRLRCSQCSKSICKNTVCSSSWCSTTSHFCLLTLRFTECIRNAKKKGPSKSICLFFLVKEAACWPLGSSKMGRWEGSMAATQRNANRLLLFEHASKCNRAEDKRVSFFIFYLLVSLNSVQSIWFKWPPTTTVIQFGSELS